MHTGRLSQASWSMINLRTAGVRERLAPHDIALGHQAETDIPISCAVRLASLRFVDQRMRPCLSHAWVSSKPHSTLAKHMRPFSALAPC